MKDNSATMIKRSHKGWGLALLGLLVAGAVVFQVAVHQLRVGLEQALGPRASVGSVSVGLTGIVLADLRVKGQRGAWPVDDELRAARVHVVPELASVFGDTWRIRRVTVDGAYVSVVRRRDGTLRVVPGLLGQLPPGPSRGAAPPARVRVRVGTIDVRGASVDFIDASVRTPAHRMRFERLDVVLDDLALPELDQTISLRLAGVFKGVKRDGDIAIHGTFRPASQDAVIASRLTGVDLIALEPYLLKVNEAGVRRGTLDLSVDATVTRGRLRAPGTLVLKDVELGAGPGLFGTFAGVPRQAVLASLGREGRIDLRFTLEGDLSDPRFSLNEVLALRIAAGMAEALGVSLGGVVQGVGGVLKGLLGR